MTAVEPFVISLYLGGKSTVEIGKMFGFSSEGVRRFLRRKAVRIRTNSETSTIHTLNHQYFSAISDETKAFWLGFVLKHGLLVKRVDGSCIMITVSDSELSLLEDFKHEVFSSKSIYQQKGRNRHVLAVNSKTWTEALKQLGWDDFRAGNRELLLSKIKTELHQSLLNGHEATLE